MPTRRRISAAPGSNASCEIGEAVSPCHGLAAWLQGTGSWHAGVWSGLAWPAGEIAPGVLLADEFAPVVLCRLAASSLIRLSCCAVRHLAVQWVPLRDELAYAREAENQVPVGTRTVPL